MNLKALPRLPSSDGDYDEFDTPKNSAINLVNDITGLPAPPSTPVKSPWAEHDRAETNDSSPAPPGPPPPSPSKNAHEQTPAERLASLRHTFHRTEQSLYAQLGRTQSSSLNDVRRSFIASAKGAEKRLCAWQKKHISTLAASQIPERLTVEEPEWWGKKCHAVPGSSAIVHEDDWGSIISYALRFVCAYSHSFYLNLCLRLPNSTSDYQRELTSLSLSRLASSPEPSSSSSEAPSTSSTHTSSSFFSAAMGYRLFAPSNLAQPDPDLDDVAWSEPETFCSVAARKGHSRDSATIMKLLRQNSKYQADGARLNPAGASTSSLAMRFGSLGAAAGQRMGGVVPPAARAKADVQISRDEADGKLGIVSDAVEEVGRILGQEAAKGEKGETFVMSRPESRASGSLASASQSGSRSLGEEGKLRHGHTPSVSSLSSSASADSDATIGKRSEGVVAKSSHTSLPPPLPPKHEHGLSASRQVDEVVQPQPQEPSPAAPVPVSVPATRAPSSSTFASTVTSGFSSAMRFVLRDHESSRPTTPAPKTHHGLLSADTAGIDDRPHIKHDWTIGKRLKFSCTVYYAKQFDALRRRCGIDDVFAKSLSHSANWAAEGGKSRSAFWKTSDDRFIIKTLVDAWNVADLYVFTRVCFFLDVDMCALGKFCWKWLLRISDTWMLQPAKLPFWPRWSVFTRWRFGILRLGRYNPRLISW